MLRLLKWFFRPRIILMFIGAGIAFVALFIIIGISTKAYKIKKRQKFIASLTDTSSPNVQTLEDTVYIDSLNEYRSLSYY